MHKLGVYLAADGRAMGEIDMPFCPGVGERILVGPGYLKSKYRIARIEHRFALSENTPVYCDTALLVEPE